MFPSTGELLLDCWHLYRRLFWELMGYMTWSLLIFALMVGVELLPLEESVRTTVINIVSAAHALAILWGILAITLMVFHIWHGIALKPNVIAELSKQRLWLFVLATILTTIAVIAGLLVFIIPGLILWILLVFTQTDIAVTRHSINEALKASIRLAKKYPWQLLKRLFTGNLLIALVWLLVTTAITSIGASLDPTLGGEIQPANTPLWAEIITGLTLTAIIPFTTLFQTRLYMAFRFPLNVDSTQKS